MEGEGKKKEEEDDEIVMDHHDLRTTIASFCGNILEWYDFSIYGLMSDVISKVFFPPDQKGHAALIESFAVFGIAFLARPIGGAIFGYMGDNISRKSALENSILLMSFPTFLLGCLPSFQSVGWWAPTLLIICRILQGFSVGGQLMSAVVFSLERQPERKWATVSQQIYAASIVGSVIGSLFAYILRETLSEEQLESWGWRIPFFFGIIGALPGLYLRKHGSELSSTTEQPAGGQNTFRQAFAPENRKAMLATILVPCFSSGVYYIVFVWLAIYMQSIAQVPEAFAINTAVGVLGIAFCFLGGWITDYLGKKSWSPLMYLSSLALAIVSPIFISIMSEGDPVLCFFLQLMMGILLSFFSAPMTPWLVSQFPPHMRLTCLNIGYNIGVSVVGGFSPAIATALVDSFNARAAGYVITGLTVFAWIGLILGSSPSGLEVDTGKKTLSDEV